MKSFIVYLEISNFERYRDKIRIDVGNVKEFRTAVGYGGEGTSIFMDALGFVLGKETSSLGARRSKDLLYSNPLGGRNARSGLVKLLCVTENNVQRKFIRTLFGNRSMFQVDGRKCMLKMEYIKELKQLGISSEKKRSFLFQGEVGSVPVEVNKEQTETKSEELENDRKSKKRELNDRIKEVDQKLASVEETCQQMLENCGRMRRKLSELDFEVDEIQEKKKVFAGK